MKIDWNDKIFENLVWQNDYKNNANLLMIQEKIGKKILWKKNTLYI